MTVATVHVETASRLHLGLFRFGQQPVQYGGVGLMIRPPGFQLSISAADKFSVAGPLADRVSQFASQWAVFHDQAELPCCQIEMNSVPTQHVGLGSGTQLGLAVVAGLSRFAQLPNFSVGDLAACAGRARRSAIGTHGFVHGGLIVEGGRSEQHMLAPLECRLPVPDSWCIVLIRPDQGQGLSGEKEQQAFGDLPPVPGRVTEQLIEEVRQQMLPALTDEDFSEFAESVYRNGNLAGSCFSSLQGGPYNGAALNQRVEWLRSIGYSGVGQSSWGPTLFVLTPDEQAAEQLQQQLEQCPTGERLVSQRAWPCNQGAKIEVRS